MSRILTSQKLLSKPEQAHLIKACRRELIMRGRRSRAALMILITLELGLRASETVDLTVGDFSLENRSLLIRSKKKSDYRELPLRISRARQIRDWIIAARQVTSLADADPESKIFAVTYSTFYQDWRFYRPHRKRKLHSLRHTFAMNLYSRTLNIHALQRALGHRSIKNTLVYMDFHYSQTNLRRMMYGG